MRNTAVLSLLMPLLLAACGFGGGDKTVEAAVIGSSDDLSAGGIHLDAGAQLVRGATVAGLVGFDAKGEVVPSLAERWIVTDDGRSYIFRLREGKWPNGRDVDGASARDALKRAIRGLRGTSMGFDLAMIADVRAMAGRVVEVRLRAPMPDFLQLLAQPELGLLVQGAGSGEMVLKRKGNVALLTPVPPEQRGEPAREDWQDHKRQVRLRATAAKRAIALFDDGVVDVVLGGRIEALPYADTGPLSRGTVRVDRVNGLFGLLVLRGDGFLADPARREALAMAIDRPALVVPFNISGWQDTTRLVAAGNPDDIGTIGERWSQLSMEQRRQIAARRVAAWREQNGGNAPELAVSLPDGPGSDALFTVLRDNLAAVGVNAVRAKPGRKSDLAMFDRLARYRSVRWYLNQFNCSLRQGLCSKESDALVAKALEESDLAAMNATLAEAEAELTAANIFIPFGPPLRWSLVRGSVAGFESNGWGIHPLAPLALTPK
jgi:ABC-type transport system substrate-binding protein